MNATLMEQRHWQPPDQLQIRKKLGWAYRYFRKIDVERRLLEGWEVCKQDERIMKETGRTDSTQNYRSLILMMIPKHMVDERNAHYRSLHERRIRASGRGIGLATKASEINSGTGKSDLTGAVGQGLVLKEGVITDEGIHHSNTTTIKVDENLDPGEMAEGQHDLKEIREAQEKSDAEAELRSNADEEVLLDQELSKGGSKKSPRKKR